MKKPRCRAPGKNRLARIIATGTALVCSWTMAADELPAVVVTAPAEKASAFSLPPAEALAELGKTPGGVAVVPAESYLSGRAGTMEDSLKLAPGVFIASRFGSDESRISIRGSGLQRTFHGRGLMVLQDGVPLNLADGSFDMQAVEPQATRYIEIERGANALRYGGSTLGGAINYISETGRTVPGLSLRAEGGSFGYQRYNIASGAQSGRLDGHASFNHVAQGGFREHADQNNWRFFGNAGVQISERVESRFYLGAVDVESELPGNLTYAQFKDDPQQANARAVARDQHRDFTLWRLANRTLFAHNDGSRTELSAYFAQKDLHHPIEFFPTGPGIIGQDTRDWGLGARHLVATRWLGHVQENIVGVQWRRGLTLDERYTYANNVFTPGTGFAVGDQPGTLDNRQKQTADNLDVYGQSSWQFTERTTGVIGVQSTVAQRRQRVVIDNVGFDPGTGAVRLPTGSYEETFRRTSPRIGFLYRASGTVEAYGNVSGSFEPPSFAESFNNQPLRAQRALTTELGMRGNSNTADLDLGWDLTLYRATVHNELLEITLNAGQPATTNADRTVHQGIEAALSAEADRWRVLASCLLNDFRFRNDPTFDNNRIAGLPDQVLNAEAALRLPHNIWLGPTLHAASRSRVDHANTKAAPGYAVYGLKVHQTLERGLAWFVEGRNLTDKIYAATTGVVRDLTAPGASQAQFSPGDGLSVFAGISQEF